MFWFMVQRIIQYLKYNTMITRILFVFSILLTLMSCASNTLTHDRGVMIGGIRWATRNVDAPKTFVASRYEVGMIYQWNSKIGWNITDPIASTRGDTVWKTLNDETSEWLPHRMAYAHPHRS